jgi:hypothetical protein
MNLIISRENTNFFLVSRSWRPIHEYWSSVFGVTGHRRHELSEILQYSVYIHIYESPIKTKDTPITSASTAVRHINHAGIANWQTGAGHCNCFCIHCGKKDVSCRDSEDRINELLQATATASASTAVSKTDHPDQFFPPQLDLVLIYPRLCRWRKNWCHKWKQVESWEDHLGRIRAGHVTPLYSLSPDLLPAIHFDVHLLATSVLPKP